MKRKVSIHELKRRLMRRMSQETTDRYVCDIIAKEVRAHAIALAFLRGRSISGIALDSDLGGAWDGAAIEAAIRRRLTGKR